MKVLFKNPGEAPEVREVENDLKPIQELVGGYIETVNLGDDILIVCNEEGKIKGLPANFYVEAIDDIIVGPAFFCRSDGYDFTDITDNDAKWICYRLGWRC
jgi:uncharacterized protein YuzE